LEIGIDVLPPNGGSAEDIVDTWRRQRHFAAEPVETINKRIWKGIISRNTLTIRAGLYSKLYQGETSLLIDGTSIVYSIKS
jgi:hypothetical protein